MANRTDIELVNILTPATISYLVQLALLFRSVLFYEMFVVTFIFILTGLRYSYCDWATDWMSPLQHEINNSPVHRPDAYPPLSNSELLQMDELSPNIDISQKNMMSGQDQSTYDFVFNKHEEHNEISADNLKLKLLSTLESAKQLTALLEAQIQDVGARENLLKEVIVNGRYGVSTVKIISTNHSPRSYIIRDGIWSLCNGMLQTPSLRASTNIFTELFSMPKCIGQEISTNKDPCVFHSVIKYETIPTQRKTEYVEDDYLCLRHNFNSTVERYLSVPRAVLNTTCHNGLVRSLEENVAVCGVRTLYEYTYHPYKGPMTATLPLEYCSQEDNSCTLIVGWDVTNGTINNFEYLKDDVSFKKYFVQTEPYINNIM